MPSHEYHFARLARLRKCRAVQIRMVSRSPAGEFWCEQPNSLANALRRFNALEHQRILVAIRDMRCSKQHIFFASQTRISVMKIEIGEEAVLERRLLIIEAGLKV